MDENGIAARVREQSVQSVHHDPRSLPPLARHQLNDLRCAQPSRTNHLPCKPP